MGYKLADLIAAGAAMGQGLLEQWLTQGGREANTYKLRISISAQIALVKRAPDGVTLVPQRPGNSCYLGVITTTNSKLAIKRRG